MTSVTDSPPVFDGALDYYKEWRRRVELWTKSTRLEVSKQAPKIVSVLSGPAWDAMRHIEIEVLTSEEGVEQVLKTLDTTFGDPKDVLLVEATDDAFYLTTKQPQQELVAFQARLDSKFRRLEATGSLTIPAEIKGLVLAKQAGLSTAEVRELLTLTGGSLQYEAVRSSMRRLMWDFSKPVSQRRVPGASKAVYVAEQQDNSSEEWQLAEALAEDDAEFSETEAQAIYLAYQEARSRLAAKKVNRGFFPQDCGGKGMGKQGWKGAGDLAAIKARSRCRRCGELGHWQKECPKKERAHFTNDGYNMASGSGGVSGSTMTSMPETPALFVMEDYEPEESSSSGTSRSEASNEYEGLGQYESRYECCVVRESLFLSSEYASPRPASSAYLVQEISDMPRANVTACYQSEEVSWHTPLACVDTGCTKSLIGQETLRELEGSLACRGAKILRQSGRCAFKFGGDFTFVAQDVAVIPCRIGHHLMCSIRAYVVPGATPLLLSLPLLQAWQSSIDLQKMSLALQRWQITLPLIQKKGHLYLDLWSSLHAQLCHVLDKAPTLQMPDCLVYGDVSSNPGSTRESISNHGRRGKDESSRFKDGSRSSERCQARASGCPDSASPNNSCLPTWSSQAIDYRAEEGAGVRRSHSSARRSDPCDRASCGVCQEDLDSATKSLECNRGSAWWSPHDDSIPGCAGRSRCNNDIDMGKVLWETNEGCDSRPSVCQVDSSEPVQDQSSRGSDADCSAATGVPGDRRSVVQAIGTSVNGSADRQPGTAARACAEDDSRRSRESIEPQKGFVSACKRRRLQKQMHAIAESALVSTSQLASPKLSILVEQVRVPEFQKCPCWSMHVENCEDVRRRISKLDHTLRCLCVIVRADRREEVSRCLRSWKSKVQLVLLWVGLRGQVGIQASSKSNARRLYSSLQHGMSSLTHSLSEVILLEENSRKEKSGSSSPWSGCDRCRDATLMPMTGQEISWWTDVPPSRVMKEVTSSLPHLLPLNPGRHTIYEEEGARVRGIHFGLLVRRGKGISQADRRWPEARRALHLLAQCRPVNHPYLAIQVNMLTESNQIPEHSDSRNYGDSWVIACGSYTGEELMLKTSDGWKRKDNHLRWVKIGKDVPHKVLPVLSGVRVSVVLYTPQGYESALSPEMAAQLEELGYPCPLCLTHLGGMRLSRCQSVSILKIVSSVLPSSNLAPI